VKSKVILYYTNDKRTKCVCHLCNKALLTHDQQAATQDSTSTGTQARYNNRV